MSKATLYYETIHGRLVPVDLIATLPEVDPGATRHPPIKHATVRVKRTSGAFHTGEIFDTFPHHLVNRTRVVGGRQYVKGAWLASYLPEVTS